MDTAKEYIESLKIIEPTDLSFRTKVPAKNSLLSYDIKVRSLSELMDDFANKKLEDYKRSLINCDIHGIVEPGALGDCRKCTASCQPVDIKY